MKEIRKKKGEVWVNGIVSRFAARHVLFFALVFAAMSQSTAGSDAGTFGAKRHVFDIRKADAAGLGFRVGWDAKENWPRLKIDTPLDTGRHISSDCGYAFHASRFVAPIDFGMMLPAEGKNQMLSECVRDSAGTELLISYEYSQNAAKPLSFGADDGEPVLRILCSRLWPGVLVSCSSDLMLFAGSVAVGTHEAVRAHSSGGGSEPSGRMLLGPKTPAWHAARTATGIAIKGREGLGELPMEEVGHGWLLVWYGADAFFHAVDQAGFLQFSAPHAKGWDAVAYKADCPILILFGEPPDALENIADYGLEISCVVGVKAVFMPLFGEYLPPAAETAKWAKDGLPKDVIERCDWVAAHVSGFPVAVSERYGHDAKTGEISIEVSFEFEDFRETGGRAAPVSPIFATAWLEGLPMSFSTEPYDPRIVTSAGSWAAIPAVEGYAITLPGIAKYAEPRPAPAGAGDAPRQLLSALESEVEKIIQAGHLAPWMRQLKNIWGGNFLGPTQWLVHANPGEVLYYLAEALPFLRPELQARTLEYMKQERETFPPENTGLLDGSSGARREWYRHSDWFLAPPGEGGRTTINAYRPSNFYVHYKLIPPETVYYLARFYESSGANGLADEWDGISEILRPYREKTDWATGALYRWPGQYFVTQYMTSKKISVIDQWYGLGGVVDANNMFAASVGLVRLARMRNDAEKLNDAYGMFARQAVRRFALGKMAGHLWRRGVLKAGEAHPSAEDDMRVPHIVDEYGMALLYKPTYDWYGGLIHCRDMIPELGVFLKDHLRVETERYYAEFEKNIPDWYYSWAGSSIHGECNCPWPQDAYQTFMAHAWIFGSDAQWLEKHIDLPWTSRGDFFYLHKLVETIRPYAVK